MLATIERSAHLVAAYLDHGLHGVSVTQAEAHVLAQLARHGPTSMGDLHREFGHKRSTLTSVIDRLESRGLVRREVNPSDRRSFVIHLTRSGKSAAQRVIRVLDELEHELSQRVAARDLEGLRRVSAALVTALERTSAG